MKKFLFTALALLTVLSAAGQTYWRPSAGLVAKARQEPIVKSFIEAQCKYEQFGVYVESVTWSGNPAGDVQTLTHIIHRESITTELRNHTLYTYGNYDKKLFADGEKVNSALCLSADSQTGRQADPWLTWLFYICNYTICDKFDFSGDGLKVYNETVKTPSSALAGDAIRTYGLKDFSRESQIALLGKTATTLWKNDWPKSSHDPVFREMARYSDVKSVGSREMEVCIALNQEQFSSLKAGKFSQAGYIYADNPLVVIAARTLGLDIRAIWYNLDKFGEKTTTLIKAQTL